ncbi:MAG: hypothetical protein OEV66_03945 [Spirochaetia bacterium]|nr:hypothetical protein [Spirochaetia bacterium]
MPIIMVPKPLREKLGEEATDSLVELFREKDEEQKGHLFDLVEERFERRLLETESRIRADMSKMEAGIRADMSKMEAGIRADMSKMEAGIRADMSKGFLEIQKQFVEVHKAIANQTRWILTALLAGAVIYPIVVKLIDKFF